MSVPAVSDVEVMGKMLSFSPDSSPVAPEEFVARYREIIGDLAEKIREEQ